MAFLIAGIFIILALGAFALDMWLGRHPLKKLDARTEKYRYRGF